MNFFIAANIIPKGGIPDSGFERSTNGIFCGFEVLFFIKSQQFVQNFISGKYHKFILDGFSTNGTFNFGGCSAKMNGVAFFFYRFFNQIVQHTLVNVTGKTIAENLANVEDLKSK